jgi:uncharacterized protein (TIGR02466 family)
MTQVTLYKADLFHTANVGTGNEIDQLKSDILELKSKNPNGVSRTNPGCWRSDLFPVENYPWLEQQVKSLIEEAHNFYSSDTTYFAGTKLDGTQYNAWVNVNDPGSRNVLHSHYSTYSCVYYVQSENTGSLRFCNPSQTLSNNVSNSPYTRDFFINPAAGDLILWPSWVPHEVEPNLSNTQRINIAMDIHVSYV